MHLLPLKKKELSHIYRADLHCHSTCSDGTHTPEELLTLAHEKGLSALCITDHNTLNAYTDALFEESRKRGIILYRGVEFSSRYQNVPVDILGYGIKKTKEILDFCNKHVERRTRRNRMILEKLKRLAIIIEEKELHPFSHSMIGRPHIAKTLLNKGYVVSIQEAFNRYLGEGKPCFIPGETFSPQETIAMIHQAGGKAFLAHPHIIRKNQILRALYTMNFDGIECYYNLFHEKENKKWLQVAKNNQWLVSGGSDFHGSFKPHISLGCAWVDQEKVNQIFHSCE